MCFSFVKFLVPSTKDAIKNFSLFLLSDGENFSHRLFRIESTSIGHDREVILFDAAVVTMMSCQFNFKIIMSIVRVLENQSL